MEYIEIKIEESKNKGFLVYPGKSIYDKIYEVFIMSFIIGSIPFSSSMFLLNAIKNNKPILIPLIILFVAITICSFLIYSLLTINKLKKVKGISGNKNRSIVKEISNDINWDIQRHNQQITVLNKNWTWTSTNWGRQLIVIYDKEDILIDCITYAQHGMKSPFHWFSSRRVEKKLRNNFILKIKNATQQHL